MKRILLPFIILCLLLNACDMNTHIDLPETSTISLQSDISDQNGLITEVLSCPFQNYTLQFSYLDYPDIVVSKLTSNYGVPYARISSDSYDVSLFRLEFEDFYTTMDSVTITGNGCKITSIEGMNGYYDNTANRAVYFTLIRPLARNCRATVTDK